MLARANESYTLPELIDAPGLSYEVLDGEAELLAGVFILPTPGHTAGHQSVVVRRRDGTVVVAGQSHHTATADGSDVLAWSAVGGGNKAYLLCLLGLLWIERLQQLDPARVVFAHDRAVGKP